MTEAKDYNRVYVASVHADLTETDLRSVFEAFGTVTKCQLARHQGYNKGHRGFGYLEFSTMASALEAIQSMNMFDLGGQFLRVGRCITPPDALTYIVSTSAVQLPTAAAVAAAAVTAKIQAIEVTAQSTPGSQATGIPPPRVIVANTERESERRDVQRLGVASGSAVYAVPPPGLVMPFIDSGSPGSSLSLSGSASPMAMGEPPVKSPRRGFGDFAPPALTIADPSTSAGGLLSKVTVKQTDPNKPASFGPSTYAQLPKSASSRSLGADSQSSVGQMTITDGNIPGDAGAVALLTGDELAKASAKTAKNKKKKQQKKNKQSDGIRPGPGAPGAYSQDTVERVTAVARGDTINDAMNTAAAIPDLPDTAPLSQQEDIEIRGGDARHMLMHKLMRVNRSRVIVLKNMVTADMVDDELEGEIKEECSRFGKVEEVIFVTEASDGSVKIFVSFQEPSEAETARQGLDQRFFGGRTVSALIYDQTLFDHHDLTG